MPGISNHNWACELKFAIDVCRQAGNLALEYFIQGVGWQMKDDNTPVTVADKECEQIITEAIARQFPADSIVGEEGGEIVASQGNKCRKWIIDPIDGTYNYARGIPIFSVLLALEEDGEIVAGVINAPAMGDMFWAAKGLGAYKNGKCIGVSTLNDLSQSQFNFGAARRILEEGFWDGFTKLVALTYRARGYGDYLGFALVCEGKAEAMLEVGVKPWDLAPMKIIVEEAGGTFSDLAGGKSIYTGNCLVSNGVLHKKFLDPLVRSVG
ncbi:MAG: inositol monophosphatase [Candidatus Melainabacteria bacterium]|nr:inositol monophosphatase [Candidatus Melainabacteria bacterium]